MLSVAVKIQHRNLQILPLILSTIFLNIIQFAHRFQLIYICYCNYLMAVVPNRQFCPTSTTFFTSFSTFHLTKLHSLSCCSSNNWIDKSNGPRKSCSRNEVRAVLNFRNGGNASSSSYGNGDSSGSSTMDKIVEKLKKFGYNDDVNEDGKVERVIEKGSVEDILSVEEGKLQNGRGRFLDDSFLGNENVFGRDGEARFPWENTAMREREETSMERRKSKTSMAEMTLPEQELTRLRNLAVRTKHKTKIGGGGVTQAVVEIIHEKWKVGEIVRLKIEGAPALNMRRMHEILERKTGGLVIWRSGTSISLYRGVSYVDPLVYHMNKKKFENSNDRTNKDPSKGISDHTERHKITNNTSWRRRDGDASYGTKDEDEPVVEVKYENEVDALLDGLGPRYTDWAECNPLPIDADLLPATVPGFRPPYRVLPYGLRATIGQKEATSLQRLARVLPPHFALGRSRQLQGLAVAMIKLWEKSSIAKVSLKRGVPLTTSERMAEDLKRLTGGVLLSRNNDFLVFYRGNNFLSPEVTKALLERECLATIMQDEEEQARLRASSFFTQTIETPEQSGTAGTLSETMDADARWAKKLDNRGKENVMREAEVMRHSTLVKKLERKLAFAVRKINKAERALFKVEAFLKPAEPSADPESITDEERYMLRKLGLRMKAFLLLGRRGVFDGTVENMHLHWKYRELVKIIVNAKTFEQVKKVAIALEAESGGVLVSVDKISKGYAVIVFRGHDYQRPSLLRPKNLLTKRKALARSIELQRREALYNHISTLQRGVDKLKSEIEQMNVVEHDEDEELYEKLDSAYSSDDDDTEDEGDEAYLETVDCEVDSHGSVLNILPETNFPYEDEDEEGDSEMGFQSPGANVYPEVSALSERADERQRSRNIVKNCFTPSSHPLQQNSD